MNKIIVAAATIVIAAVTHAASVNWGGAICAPNGEDPLSEGQVALLLWSETGFSGAATSLSCLSAGASANNGGTVVHTHTLTAAEVGTDWNFGATYDKPGESVDGYYAIMIADEAGTSATYMDMGQISGTTAISAPSRLMYNENWEDSDTASLAEGGYNVTVDIPEPTSGLLLILGMAGLALRRRRA